MTEREKTGEELRKIEEDLKKESRWWLWLLVDVKAKQATSGGAAITDEERKAGLALYINDMITPENVQSEYEVEDLRSVYSKGVWEFYHGGSLETVARDMSISWEMALEIYKTSEITMILLMEGK